MSTSSQILNYIIKYLWFANMTRVFVIEFNNITYFIHILESDPSVTKKF